VAKSPPLKVAILWHMHQPVYREPNSNRLAMPWVRLHALKDYLDMPLNAAKYESTKVTFNLVPSLLDQLNLYLEGGTDRLLELSRIEAQALDSAQRLEILDTFFTGNPSSMIHPFRRYRELYSKWQTSRQNRGRLASLFSTSEIRDLQVWSNLSWVDPLFRNEEPVKYLYDKERHFTEDDKSSLLDWEIELIGRIVPTYRRLLEEKRIEISFTPYYHPILPLLCDTNVAQEALPSITLPRERFVHPEDAEKQISMAVKKYESVFGRPLQGMWPSEGSVSEEVLGLLMKSGIKWAATDQEILFRSLEKSGMSREENPLHTVYEYGPGLKLFFRDHALSDRIGFVYSGWPADRAVADFMGHLKSLRNLFGDQLDRTVVPIILDGENAWEYFPNDGGDFLDGLYRELEADPDMETVTFSEAAEQIEARPLKSIYAGSWIGHNFRIWIGHEEDNAAWDLLSRTRDMVVQFEKENPDFDRSTLDRIWEQIYIAEGSDWCWWYGDEHRGAYNEEFDKIFRNHLIAVYESIGQETPSDLLRAIHGGGVSSYTVYPDDILTAQIDGSITHFYEWAGAGYFDCVKAGGAMHRADRRISGIHFAYDHNRLYIRLDFSNKKSIDLLKDAKFVVALFTPSPRLVELKKTGDAFVGEVKNSYQFAMDDILELAIDRSFIWPEEFGRVGFNVTLLDGDNKLESWPEHEPVQLMVSEKHQELFWPS